MTAPTPEQLRVRADRLEASARGVPESDTYAQALVFNALLAADNIRAAADQLEGVRVMRDTAAGITLEYDSDTRHDRTARAIVRVLLYDLDRFTADTAPQEDHDA